MLVGCGIGVSQGAGHIPSCGWAELEGYIALTPRCDGDSGTVIAAGSDDEGGSSGRHGHSADEHCGGAVVLEIDVLHGRGGADGLLIEGHSSRIEQRGRSSGRTGAG